MDKFYKSIGEPQGMSCAAIRISALKDVGPYFVGFFKGRESKRADISFKQKRI